MPISDAGLASLGKLTALEDLELNELDQLGSPGFAHLVDCHALKTFLCRRLHHPSGMLENLAAAKNLESVTLPGTVLKDADIASLSALTKLSLARPRGLARHRRRLCHVPMRLPMTTAAISTKPGGVDDAILKNIRTRLSQARELDVKLAPAGFTHGGRLSDCEIARPATRCAITGAGVTDETAASSRTCDGLTTLAIPAAPTFRQGRDRG